MAGQTYVLGVDVGGTKIKVGAMPVGRAGPADQIRVADQCSTPRVDPSPLYDAIAEMIHRVRAKLGHLGEGCLPLTGVAHPGRFLQDGSLARGTTPNLGRIPNQFDGLRPAEALRRRVGGQVYAENDAVAQMRFGLAALLSDPAIQPSLLGQTAVYLGPGTGMGGGAAHVGPDGAVTTFSDGQLFDIQVPGYGDSTLTSEELFTGPAIARLVIEANARLQPPIEPASAEQVGRLLADTHALRDHRSEARRIADHLGEVLASIIETIHAGRIIKVRLESLNGRIARHVNEPDRAWPAGDVEAIRGARRFILGGSVGINPVLGGHLRSRALECLRQRGLTNLAIFQIPVASADSGVLGAVRAIPMGQLRTTG